MAERDGTWEAIERTRRLQEKNAKDIAELLGRIEAMQTPPSEGQGSLQEQIEQELLAWRRLRAEMREQWSRELITSELFELDGVAGRAWTIHESFLERFWQGRDKIEFTQLPDGRWWEPRKESRLDQIARQQEENKLLIDQLLERIQILEQKIENNQD